MQIKSLRSSSYNTYSLCQNKYFISYILNIKEVSGSAANKGSCVHKALELLARYKLATQNSKTVFFDDSTGQHFVEDFTVDKAFNIAWNYVTNLKEDPNYVWTEKDYKDCWEWTNHVLTWKDGLFSPLKREIVVPEQYFEFEVDEPWAVYNYNGDVGRLKLYGSMDLFVKCGNDLEYIDWKTSGSRMDWAKFQQKSYEDLFYDPQLRLYHFAATKLWPHIENIWMTIFFIRADGPETLCFTKDDIPDTIDMIRKRFEQIKNNMRPSIVYPSKKCSFCYYQKNGFDGPVENWESGICSQIYNEMQSLGMEKVVEKYGKESKGYSGGGRNV